MTVTVLNDIRFSLNRQQLFEELRLTNKGTLSIEFNRKVDEAETLGRPKALFKRMDIAEKRETYIVLKGIQLISRVLRVNVEETDVLYPALITCGSELENWSATQSEMLHHFWAETIKERILSLAITEVWQELNRRYAPGKLSLMTPGSLNDWPLSEQESLFRLYEGAHRQIGVSLSENYLMHPLKTVSGVFFAGEEAFDSCRLCAKVNCPGRRMPFESGLYEKKYQPQGGAGGELSDSIGRKACPEPGGFM